MKRRWVSTATLVAAAAGGYHEIVRPWHESRGATQEVVDAALPGDQHVAEPATQNTRGITINAGAAVRLRRADSGSIARLVDPSTAAAQ